MVCSASGRAGQVDRASERTAVGCRSESTADTLGLESTPRPRGRPKKAEVVSESRGLFSFPAIPRVWMEVLAQGDFDRHRRNIVFRQVRHGKNFSELE